MLYSEIEKYAKQELKADYLLSRINVGNVPNINGCLKKEGSFIGRTEVGNFPDGSKVLGLNVFFPVNSENIKENCVFLKSPSIDKINFPIRQEQEYERFCSLIKSGYVLCKKGNNIEICKPYVRVKEQENSRNVILQ